MPLVIELKKGEKIVINGAIIEAPSDRDSKIIIQNKSAILRGNEFMLINKANTICKRLYYCVQTAYLLPVQKDEKIKEFDNLANKLVAHVPETFSLVKDVSNKIVQEQFYPALKVLKKLINYEAEDFKQLMFETYQSNEQFEKKLEEFEKSQPPLPETVIVKE